MRKAAIITAILAQVLILAWMAGQREWILRTAPRIWLRTAPLDPRDLFRGDYVTLRYDIAAIGAEKFGPALRDRIAAIRAEEKGSGESGQELVIFTALRPGDGGVMTVAQADLAPPASGPFIKGRIRKRAMRSEPLTGVAYGIDAFFVEQGRGRALEQAPEGKGRLEMEVALGKDGTAMLTGYRWPEPETNKGRRRQPAEDTRPEQRP